MKYLSRSEEIILLSIWKLQDNAYGMSIREQVKNVTGVHWSFGAIYAPLNRLLKKEFVSSFNGDPTPERGGRSKVFYTLTEKGKEALRAVKEVNEAIWIDIPSFGLDKG